MKPPVTERETELQSDLLAAHGIVTRACPTLRWKDAAGTHEFRMMNDKAVLGSSDGVDVHVRDPKVSRMHAEFEIRENALWVKDIGSRNGVYVSGVRVTGARITDGAVVHVGDTDVVAHLTAPPVPVELWPHDHFGSLVGRSVAARALFHVLSRIAPLDEPVLIQGETGTGKDEAARAIHGASKRSEGPFVVVDCGALSETLLESSLFGHTRGAFTDAATDQAGSIEAADGGTVFLDEIGELPLELQPKLLRAVETQMVRRLGENEYRKVSVRFLSATHQNLRERVNEGTFREDLYFRLAVLPISLPPLRERREDIPLLVERFLQGAETGALAPELVRALEDRPWRGNIRELRNFVSRVRALGVDHAFAGAPAAKPTASSLPLFTEARDRAQSDFERTYVLELLARHQGNVGAAAEAAGVTSSYLYKLMKRNGL